MKKTFKVRNIKKKDEKHKYPDNLHIIKEHSFFNVDAEIFCLKFPVPNVNYKVKNIYNFSSNNRLRIVIHINDGTAANAQNGKKDYIMSCIFGADDLIDIYNSRIKLKENLSLSVIVYNDDRPFSPKYITGDDFENLEAYYESNNEIKKIFSPSETLLPDEKEGGVIIVGP